MRYLHIPFFLAFMALNTFAAKEDDMPALIKAAEQGDVESQVYLGGCYLIGVGVPKDEIEAVRWFQNAAAKGDATAQTKLGLCYETGEGVPKDPVEAVRWYRKAAEQGNALAQGKLGFCYEKGVGVLKDEETAVKWYQKGAEQGDVRVALFLGLCYAYGNGVPSDMVKAYAWLNFASVGGSDTAKDQRDKVTQRMSSDQIAEATRLSQKFFEKYKPKK